MLSRIADDMLWRIADDILSGHNELDATSDAASAEARAAAGSSYTMWKVLPWANPSSEM